VKRKIDRERGAQRMIERDMKVGEGKLQWEVERRG